MPTWDEIQTFSRVNFKFQLSYLGVKQCAERLLDEIKNDERFSPFTPLIYNQRFLFDELKEIFILNGSYDYIKLKDYCMEFMEEYFESILNSEVNQ